MYTMNTITFVYKKLQHLNPPFELKYLLFNWEVKNLFQKKVYFKPITYIIIIIYYVFRRRNHPAYRSLNLATFYKGKKI